MSLILLSLDLAGLAGAGAVSCTLSLDLADQLVAPVPGAGAAEEQ